MDNESSDKLADVTNSPLDANNFNNEPDPEAVKWFKENSIPIVFIILAALLVCLIIHYSSIKIDLVRTKDFADALKNFVEVIAIIIGGVWAFFRFRIGREFKESLIPIISGRLFVVDNQTYLVVNTQIKNVGQSKIEFLPKASTVKLWEYKKTSSTNVVTVPDEPISQFDPLEEIDRYIEPNEIIEGTRLVTIPHILDLGVRLELQVISSQHNYTWRSARVVEKTSPSGNIDTGRGL